MARVSYQVQQLDGYTDGRPSWCKVFVPRIWDKVSAEAAARELRERHPYRKFRVRKITRK